LIDIVDKIYKFNEDAGLIDAGYDDFLEDSFTIEESLEQGSNLKKLGSLIHPATEDLETPKDISRAICNILYKQPNSKQVSDVDRADKIIDKVVFAIGGLAKLGLTREQAYRAIDVVLEANLQKLGCPKDSEGKLMKPKGFKNPEEELEKILKERNE
jgi:predicted HAD superfamily Cof-like phosphohydrolase